MDFKSVNKELDRKVKELKQALKLSEQAGEEAKMMQVHYQALFEDAPVGIWGADSKGQSIIFNSKLTDITGLTSETAREKGWQTALHPNDRQEVIEYWTTFLKGKKSPYKKTHRFLRPDGDVVWVVGQAIQLLDSNEKPIGYIGIVTDITERVKSEKIVKENEERFREMADFLPTAIIEMAMEGHITYVNNAGLELFGFSQSDFEAGINGLERVHPDELEKAARRIEQVGRGEKLKNLEFRLRKKDGSEITAVLNGSPIFKEKKIVGLRVSIVDLTWKKNLETQLQQVQKFEAIANLAGGIAHQYNNALFGVIGNIDLLKMYVHDRERALNYAERVKENAYHMARLTNQLLAYARGGKYQEETISLYDFVKETLPLLKHSVGLPVVTDSDTYKNKFYVKADVTQLQMVLAAVLDNASEAINKDGCIQISIEKIDVGSEYLTGYPDCRPGRYVRLTIKDDGKGMDKETKSRIFEPFFSTKFQGRGLGMAAAYGVIRNHHGWISIDSKLNKGTAVHVYLPELEKQEKENAKLPGETPVRSATILVVEDEAFVMELIRDILEGLGYRVLAAETGERAMEVAESYDEVIDLAILDIVLPDMKGQDLYPLLMGVRPDLKVLVSSGYSIDGPARKILEAGAQDFIQKPFSVKDISEKLKALI